MLVNASKKICELYFYFKNSFYICKPNGRFMNDTKSYILETSFKLFLQKSFKEVTMKEIVEKTGLSKGAFYHYFESKEQLFNEIVDKYYMAFFYVDYSRFSQNNLRDFYHEYFHYAETELKSIISDLGADQNEVVINYYLMIFDAINIYPGFKEKVKELTDHELNSWKSAVTKARERGEIKSSMTDEQITKILVRTNDGIGLHAIMHGKMDTMIQELLDVLDGFYEEIKA